MYSLTRIGRDSLAAFTASFLYYTNLFFRVSSRKYEILNAPRFFSSVFVMTHPLGSKKNKKTLNAAVVALHLRALSRYVSCVSMWAEKQCLIHHRDRPTLSNEHKKKGPWNELSQLVRHPDYSQLPKKSCWWETEASGWCNKCLERLFLGRVIEQRHSSVWNSLRATNPFADLFLTDLLRHLSDAFHQLRGSWRHVTYDDEEFLRPVDRPTRE